MRFVVDYSVYKCRKPGCGIFVFCPSKSHSCPSSKEECKWIRLFRVIIYSTVSLPGFHPILNFRT